MASVTVAIPPAPHNEESHSAGTSEIRPDMLFPVAAETYLKSRRVVDAGSGLRYRGPRYVRATTLTNYERYVTSLSLFFGKMRLDEIRLDHIRQYQLARATGAAPFIRRRRPHEEPAPCPTKPAHVNQELGLLGTIMRRALVWNATFTDYYEELSEDISDVPQALTADEESRWLEISASQERWHLVHWYSLIAFATCMSTNEFRALRLRDINIAAGVLTVPNEGSKVRSRHRTVPIQGEEALWALGNLIRRAEQLGAREPLHYLFPGGRNRSCDPTQPMSNSGLKRAWNEMRQATGLLHFTPYDTRHTAISRLAEAGVPVTVIMDMAGHMSPRMTQHYTHISEQAKVYAMRQAQNVREGRPAQQATARKRVAPAVMAPAPVPQIPAQHGTVSALSWGLNWTGTQR
jgi:integrase